MNSRSFRSGTPSPPVVVHVGVAPGVQRRWPAAIPDRSRVGLTRSRPRRTPNLLTPATITLMPPRSERARRPKLASHAHTAALRGPTSRRSLRSSWRAHPTATRVSPTTSRATSGSSTRLSNPVIRGHPPRLQCRHRRGTGPDRLRPHRARERRRFSRRLVRDRRGGALVRRPKATSGTASAHRPSSISSSRNSSSFRSRSQRPTSIRHSGCHSKGRARRWATMTCRLPRSRSPTAWPSPHVTVTSDAFAN